MWMMCKNYSNVRITCCEPIRAGGGGVGEFDFHTKKGMLDTLCRDRNLRFSCNLRCPGQNANIFTLKLKVSLSVAHKEIPSE